MGNNNKITENDVSMDKVQKQVLSVRLQILRVFEPIDFHF